MTKRNQRKIDVVQRGEDSYRKIKDKFVDERETEIMSRRLVPMNEKQKLYMQLVEDKDVVVATGLAGTSKSYIPLCIAADNYRLGLINKIILTRPAISSSQSLGFFSGSDQDKMAVWLAPAISVLKERLGIANYEIAHAKGDVQFIPLEVIKGSSFNNCFVIAEESSDLTKDEIVKLITRMGKNSKLIISGDVRQSELNAGAGMKWIVGFVQRNDLDGHFGYVDFNSVNDIVRSGLVKSFLTAVLREELKGGVDG